MSLAARLAIVAVFISFCGCDAKPAGPGGQPGGQAGGSPAASSAEAQSPDQHIWDLLKLAMEVHNHHDKHKRIPLDIKAADGTPLLSWRVELLEVLDPQLYQQFHLQEAWDSPHNSTLMAKVPKWYVPSGGSRQDGKTTLMMFQGPQTIFENPRAKFNFSEIFDGTSKTLIYIEAPPDKAVPWTKPADLTFDAANPLAAIGAFPDTGLLGVFCDGQVRRISKDTPPPEFAAMITPRGGEQGAVDTWAPSAKPAR